MLPTSVEVAGRERHTRASDNPEMPGSRRRSGPCEYERCLGGQLSECGGQIALGGLPPRPPHSSSTGRRNLASHPNPRRNPDPASQHPRCRQRERPRAESPQPTEVRMALPEGWGHCSARPVIIPIAPAPPVTLRLHLLPPTLDHNLAVPAALRGPTCCVSGGRRRHATSVNHTVPALSPAAQNSRAGWPADCGRGAQSLGWRRFPRWCNRQHPRFWSWYSRFESSAGSHNAAPGGAFTYAPSTWN